MKQNLSKSKNLKIPLAALQGNLKIFTTKPNKISNNQRTSQRRGTAKNQPETQPEANTNPQLNKCGPQPQRLGAGFFSLVFEAFEG